MTEKLFEISPLEAANTLEPYDEKAVEDTSNLPDTDSESKYTHDETASVELIDTISQNQSQIETISNITEVQPEHELDEKTYELIDEFIKRNRGKFMKFTNNESSHINFESLHNVAESSYDRALVFLESIENEELRENVRTNLIRGTTFLSHVCLSLKKNKGDVKKESLNKVKIELANGNTNALEELLKGNDSPSEYFDSIIPYLPNIDAVYEEFEDWKRGVMTEYKVAKAIINSGRECTPTDENTDFYHGYDLTTENNGNQIPVDVKTFKGPTTIIGITWKNGNAGYFRNGSETSAIDLEQYKISKSVIEYANKNTGKLLVCRINNDNVDEISQQITGTIDYL